MHRSPLNDSNYIKNLKSRRFFDLRLKWYSRVRVGTGLSMLLKKTPA
jgi:hypothetical protein